MLIIVSCQTEPLIDDSQQNQDFGILKPFSKEMNLEDYAELIEAFREHPNKSNIIYFGALNETESFITDRKGTIHYYNYNQELQLFETIDSFSGRVIDFEKYPNKLPTFEICSTSESIDTISGGVCTSTVTYHPFNILYNVSYTVTCGVGTIQSSSTTYTAGGLATALILCGIDQF